jgi:hypothetical protein
MRGEVRRYGCRKWDGYGIPDLTRDRRFATAPAIVIREALKARGFEVGQRSALLWMEEAAFLRSKEFRA